MPTICATIEVMGVGEKARPAPHGGPSATTAMSRACFLWITSRPNASRMASVEQDNEG